MIQQARTETKVGTGQNKELASPCENFGCHSTDELDIRIFQVNIFRFYM